MKKNIYPTYNPASELIAIPFIINNIIRRKTIKARLNEIIEKAKKGTLNETLTEQERIEKQIEYKNLDNFFAADFKALENSKAHSFDDKIKYCLDKYAKEAKSLLSAANTVVLEENFLIGAKKTLGIYYLLEKYNTDSNRYENYLDITEIEDVTHKSIRINKNVTNVVQTDEIDFCVIGIDKTAPNLNHSEKFQELFINKELFNEIDFTLLKDFNIIYKNKTEGLEFNSRYISDLSLLLIILDDKKIINLPILKYINEILIEMIGKTVSPTIFSECRTKYSHPKKRKPSSFDLDAIKNINIFISEYLTKI